MGQVSIQVDVLLSHLSHDHKFKYHSYQVCYSWNHDQYYCLYTESDFCINIIPNTFLLTIVYCCKSYTTFINWRGRPKFVANLDGKSIKQNVGIILLVQDSIKQDT